jgi:aryl-alcohol dehydrogenase-like predicted oxidoreductase
MTRPNPSNAAPSLRRAGGLPSRQLGRTGLRVTEVGLGAAPLGNLYNEISDEQARATLTVDLPAAALQFPLAHPQVACVIPGLESPPRVSQAIQQYEASIPPEFWADLHQQALLRADAPIPDESGVAA